MGTEVLGSSNAKDRESENNKRFMVGSKMIAHSPNHFMMHEISMKITKKKSNKIVNEANTLSN
jgi:hypothetical protein